MEKERVKSIEDEAKSLPTTPSLIDIPLDNDYKPHYLNQDAGRDADDEEIENAKMEHANSQYTDSQPRVSFYFSKHIIILAFDQSDL